jgi:hypothetical protein
MACNMNSSHCVKNAVDWCETFLFATLFNRVNFWQKINSQIQIMLISLISQLTHTVRVVTLPADLAPFQCLVHESDCVLIFALMFHVWLSLHCKDIHKLWWYHVCFRWVIFHCVVYLKCKLISHCMLQVECREPRTPEGGGKVILPHVTYCWYQQLSAFHIFRKKFRPFQSASSLSTCKKFFVPVIADIVYESGCCDTHISTAHDIKMHLSAHIIRV